MKFFCSRVFPWPFVLVGAVALFFGGRNLIWAHESVTWPTVEGRVVHSKTTSYMSHHRHSSSRMYHAEVEYRYKVSGLAYSSDRVSFGDHDTGDPSDAQEIVNRYPGGISVLVHYDPASPDLGVLEPGVHGGNFISLSIGLVFFGVGCLMVWGLPKLFRMEDAAEAGKC